MAMHPHDAKPQKDRVQRALFRQKRMDRRIKFICPFGLAEQQGFEPWHPFRGLRDFESRLFDHLSTAPHIKLLERAERSGKTLERILGENPQKNALKQSPKSGLKPRKIGFPLPKSQLDFESFSLRPLRYISKYIFMANLRFVYRKSALKLGTVAVRILLENASFRQALKPVRTSKLTFPRVIWRHPAKHPLAFRVRPLTTT